MITVIKKIAILGAGTMGHGIAESFARFGYDVNLYDINAAALEKAKEFIRQELELFVEESFLQQAKNLHI